MEAKDTVMTEGDIREFYKRTRDSYAMLLAQAEISFKAGYEQREEDRCDNCFNAGCVQGKAEGIKEVVEYIGDYTKPFPNQREWKLKLKEWGIV